MLILPDTRPSPGGAAHPDGLPWSPWLPGPCPRAMPRGGPPCAGHSLHALSGGPPGGPARESLSPTSQRQGFRGPELAGWGFPAKGRCSKHRGVTGWGSRVQPLGKLCVHSWILKRVRDRPLGKSRLPHFVALRALGKSLPPLCLSFPIFQTRGVPGNLSEAPPRPVMRPSMLRWLLLPSFPRPSSWSEPRAPAGTRDVENLTCRGPGVPGRSSGPQGLSVPRSPAPPAPFALEAGEGPARPCPEAPGPPGDPGASHSPPIAGFNWFQLTSITRRLFKEASEMERRPLGNLHLRI